MKRVIVTGATGFIGRHTLRILKERGFDVHAVTSKNVLNTCSDYSWHTIDLLDYQKIRDLLSKVQPTHLLHLAWYAVPGSYWTSEENFVWVQTSLELLRQFREQGGHRVVVAGTCAEYDWNYGYCKEYLTPRLPNTPYGTCKNAFYEMLNAYSQQTGLSSAWGRIFFLYGLYEHPNRLVSSVIRALLNQEDACCSHGNQIRDFLYVEDVAKAFVAILDTDIRGSINIASGKPVAIKELVYKIADKVGRPDLIRLGAISTSSNEPQLLLADVNRLSNEVGWFPDYDLDTGIEKTINWWKNNLFGINHEINH